MPIVVIFRALVGETATAVHANAAPDIRGYDNPITGLEASFGAGFHDDAEDLVSEDHTGRRGMGLRPLEDLQVGSADPARLDGEHHVIRSQQLSDGPLRDIEHVPLPANTAAGIVSPVVIALHSAVFARGRRRRPVSVAAAR